MRRLLPLLAIALLTVACNAAPSTPPPPQAPSSAQPPSQAIAPTRSAGDEELGEEEASEPADAPTAAEESPSTAPAAEAPGEQPTPPVAVAAGPTPSPQAEINPYAMFGRDSAVTINPYTPPAPNASLSSETHAVAEPFLQAVLRRDLAAARDLYAPAARPERWANIIPAELASTQSDFSECLGLTPSVTDVPVNDTRYSVVFRFSSECAKVPILAPGAPEPPVQRFGGLGVQLEKSNGRWWVTGLATFRSQA